MCEKCLGKFEEIATLLMNLVSRPYSREILDFFSAIFPSKTSLFISRTHKNILIHHKSFPRHSEHKIFIAKNKNKVKNYIKFILKIFSRRFFFQFHWILLDFDKDWKLEVNSEFNNVLFEFLGNFLWSIIERLLWGAVGIFSEVYLCFQRLMK